MAAGFEDKMGDFMLGSKYNFHRDCIHYPSVVKIPKPEKGRPGRMHISCEVCRGMHYFNDSDFENIKTSCMYFEPYQNSLDWGGDR